MAIRAAFTAIDDAAALLADAQAERMRRRHAARFLFQHTSRPDTEQRDRHREERHAADARHHIRHAKKARDIPVHAPPEAACARRGAMCSTGSRPTVSSIDLSPAPRGPVVKPASKAMKPAPMGMAEPVRTIQ